MTDYGIRRIAGQGELEINGVSLYTPAWWTLDVSPLWGVPAVRGGNVRIPGADGTLALPRRVDETTYDVTLWITGAVDHLGAPHSDPVQGLADNLDYLWANLAAPPAPPAATVPLLLTMPDNSQRSGYVQCVLELGDLAGPYDKPAVLKITVPAGRLTVEPSS